MCLDAAQLAELELIYVGPTKDGMHMYVDKPAAAPPSPAQPAAVKKPSKAKASPSKAAMAAVAPVVKPEPVEDGGKGKRKLEEDDVENFDATNMQATATASAAPGRDDAAWDDSW